MYLQFKDDFNFPRVREVNYLGIKEQFGSDEYGNSIKLYSIVDMGVYTLQDILGIAVSDITHEIAGNKNMHLWINGDDTFDDDAEIACFDSLERCLEVFGEITKAIEEGKRLYILPEKPEGS